MLGGQSPSPLIFNNDIEFITFASTGTITNWGTFDRMAILVVMVCKHSTRAVFIGGQTGPAASDFTNRIDYVTIASTGDAQDFGDLSASKNMYKWCCWISTRGLFAGGSVQHQQQQIILIL